MEPGYTDTTRTTRSAEAFLVGDSRKIQNEKLGSLRWSGQAPEEVTQGLPGFQEDCGEKRKVL